MADFASVMQKVDKPGPGPTSLQLDDLRLYKARWIILVVYMLYSMANAVHWIQYSIISNIMVKFYGVSNFAIDTTSTIYMIVYVPLVVPASWILDRLVSAVYCVDILQPSMTTIEHRNPKLCHTSVRVLTTVHQSLYNSMSIEI